MEIINTSNPIVIIIFTLIISGIIWISRKTEDPTLPGLFILVMLFILVVHSVTLEGISPFENTRISSIYFAIAVDLTLLLLNFLSYLWIDDISAKKKNKKSYDDSLSWFWEKQIKRGK